MKSVYLFLVFVCACASVPNDRTMSETDQGVFVDRLRTRVGLPYRWGGNGPKDFDCSGLIVWALAETYGSWKDMALSELVQHHTIPIEPHEVRQGDLILIADQDAQVSHVGVFLQRTEHGVRFINASGFYGKVVADTWPENQEVRSQRIRGYVRVLSPAR